MIEEAARRRQSGGGSQEAPGDTQRRQVAFGRHQRAPGGSQEAPRSVSVSVSGSVPILLLLLNVFEGPRHMRAAGQRLRDPR